MECVSYADVSLKNLSTDSNYSYYHTSVNLFGATENAGVENMAQSKMQGWKTREWKTWHQIAGVENTGVENGTR